MTETPTLQRNGRVTGPTPYGGFGPMPIAGEWRGGSSGRHATDKDPGGARPCSASRSRVWRNSISPSQIMLTRHDATGNHNPNTAFRDAKTSGPDRYGGAWGIEEFIPALGGVRALPRRAAVSDRRAAHMPEATAAAFTPRNQRIPDHHVHNHDQWVHID
ncbi:MULTISPECIES: hypothetical protein [Nocardioides]|uniref:Uncharacterized protein n=1 Tax=Nocardioides vastitatis TaxID=2568655 RepID=A0ABW0ZSQ2_9ACTN|nr:hypothetical protein [Nocardioides sp.]THI92769.1 hypothetical protein E7Z54_21495 [Nocardioides sp.]